LLNEPDRGIYRPPVTQIFADLSLASRLQAHSLHSIPIETYLPGVATALTVSSASETYIAGGFSPTVITAGALGTGANPIEAGAVYLLRLNSTGTGLVFGAFLGDEGFKVFVATYAPAASYCSCSGKVIRYA
jgi:hypothetical protein